MFHPLRPHNSKRSPPPLPYPSLPKILPQHPPPRCPRTNLPTPLHLQPLHLHSSLLLACPPPRRLAPANPQRMPPNTRLRSLTTLSHRTCTFLFNNDHRPYKASTTNRKRREFTSHDPRPVAFARYAWSSISSMARQSPYPEFGATVSVYQS
jgi:hypothetical protein